MNVKLSLLSNQSPSMKILPGSKVMHLKNITTDHPHFTLTLQYVDDNHPLKNQSATTITEELGFFISSNGKGWLEINSDNGAKTVAMHVTDRWNFDSFQAFYHPTDTIKDKTEYSLEFEYYFE